MNELKRAWIKKHKKKTYPAANHRRIKRTYGITWEERETLLKSQEGCCAICKKLESQFKSRLAIDHCHTTGRIRGLLCVRCNTGIGNLNSPELLTAATKYLQYTQLEGAPNDKNPLGLRWV
jgi:hypothetical protein